MYNVQIDFDKQCGECEEYHFVIYKWTSDGVWENWFSGTGISPEECFSNAMKKYEELKNEQKTN